MSVQAQQDDPHSTLALYRAALRIRRQQGFGDGELRWRSAPDEDALVFDRGSLTCAVNLGPGAIPAPAGQAVVLSSPLVAGQLAPDSGGWWLR